MLRARLHIPVWTLLCLYFAPQQNAAAQSGSQEYPRTLHAVSRQIPIVKANQRIALQDSFIVYDSERLTLSGKRLRRGSDYVFNYFTATVALRNDSSSLGDTLHVAYTRLRPGIPRFFARRQLIAPPGDSSGTGLVRTRIPDRTRTDAFLDLGSELKRSGSLIRGVSVGTNQNLRVESGLRLQVDGKISENVTVTAALTDQDTPIQPEGNTQTLQEIDKIFIEIAGPKLSATLGDYTLGFSGTEFARYSRKLQGASGTYSDGDLAVKMFGAVSKGKFRTMQFQGMEGNQGPYQLTGDRNQIDLVVLAGTERVWIDGVEMVRGENNDYVIEYGNGQITFTRNRLITGDSRITVDFQYSDERFQRTLFGAEARYQTRDARLKLQTTLLRESDDSNNPLGLPLTDELRRTLSEAGDSLAFVSGAAFVGENEGEYLLQDTVYVYVGPGNGDYRVRFSDIGPGLGSYRYAGFGQYIFVGEGAGRYLPIVILPRAQRSELADVRLEFAPSPGIALRTELALSRFDENLYSRSGDDDNGGQAWLLEMDLAPDSLRLLGRDVGKASLHLRRRQRGRRYRDIDRADEIEFGRKWDLGTESASGGETISEGEVLFEPWDSIRFSGVVGALDNPAGLSSRRWHAQTSWQRPKLAELDYRIEEIRREVADTSESSRWRRQRGQARRRIGFLTPVFELENEVREQTVTDSLRDGFRFDRYTGGADFSAGRPLSGGVRFSRRTDDDRVGGIFSEASTAYTQNYRLDLSGWRGIRASASYVHRDRQFADSLRPDVKSDLAEIRLGYNGANRAVEFDTRYQITNTQVARQERVFFQVREGEGNYRFEEEINEYVLDPFGDFVLRLVPTTEFVPVIELRNRVHMRLRPARFWRDAPSGGLAGALSKLSSETLVRVEEKTRTPDAADIYFFRFSRYQDPDFTLFGNLSLRNDLHLFENRRAFSLRYRLIASKSLNNQFLEGAQNRREARHELRMNLGLTKRLASQTELVYFNEDKRFTVPGRPDRLLRGFRTVAELSYRPKPRWELAFSTILGRDSDRVPIPETQVTQVTLHPRTVYAFSGRGQLRADFAFSNVTVSPAGRFVPYELAQGNRAGKTAIWNVSFAYRVSGQLNVSLSYQGRDEPHRPRTLHIARAEMRAYF